MSIPLTAFMWIVALLPIALLLVLLIGFGWSATKAAAAGLIVAALTGIVFYKADLTLLITEGIKGVWSSLTIILIVWTAILLYQVGEEAGAFRVISEGMRRLLPNELLLILAMGWVFESFLQGITGFGVPVAVGAPLLIGLGVTPLWAVIIPLLGQSWGNTFGTLAAAWDSLALSAGLSAGTPEYLSAAFWTALFIFCWDLIVGLAICWFYGRGEAVKKGLPAVIILTLIQGGGELILSQINTTLSCFLPSVVSLIVIIFLGRMPLYRESWSMEKSPIMDRGTLSGAGTGINHDTPADMTLAQAFIPYILLSVITLTVLLVTPINTLLGRVSIGFSFPETSTGYGYVNAASAKFSPIQPFTHASMFLFVSALIGLIYNQRKGWIKEGGAGRAFKKSFDMTKPSALAVIGLVVISKFMDGTGQTIVLANGISKVLGKGYIVLAPFIGLLGTFMTGSNMSSNILFGGFQMTTAGLLGVEPSMILGAQSAGGAIGSVLSPSKIILGTTTANILGSEGEVLRKLMLITLPAVAIIGIASFVLLAL